MKEEKERKEGKKKKGESDWTRKEECQEGGRERKRKGKKEKQKRKIKSK